MNQRNTHQKYLILKVIKDSINHPTIAEVCENVQKIDSSIGQATVYRNVKRFLAEGKVYKIKTKNGIDRYDCCTNHVHFECLRCGKITDIMDEVLLNELKNRFQNRKETIQNYNLTLEGICEDCINK